MAYILYWRPDGGERVEKAIRRTYQEARDLIEPTLAALKAEGRPFKPDMAHLKPKVAARRLVAYAVRTRAHDRRIDRGALFIAREN